MDAHIFLHHYKINMSLGDSSTPRLEYINWFYPFRQGSPPPNRLQNLVKLYFRQGSCLPNPLRDHVKCYFRQGSRPPYPFHNPVTFYFRQGSSPAKSTTNLTMARYAEAMSMFDDVLDAEVETQKWRSTLEQQQQRQKAMLSNWLRQYNGMPLPA